MSNYKKVDTLIVFENGTVWRELKTKCKITGLTMEKTGYKRVIVNKKMVLVHRLVAELFLGKSDLTIDHIDGNKLNNAVSNLEYVTRKENLSRGWKNGLFKNQKGSRAKKVLWNGKVYNSAKELSLLLELSEHACVSAIKTDCNLKGYKPKYV